LGAEVDVTADGTTLQVMTQRIPLQESCRVTPNVAQVEITVKGTSIATDVMVTASLHTFSAGTKVSITRREQKERSAGGIFRGYNFVPLERKIQTLFDPEGWILINTRDPVNRRYFGEEPFRAVEENAHCQVRLADLVLNECLQMMVSQALQEAKLDRRFPNNPEIDVQNYSAEKKFEIGPQIHELIVTKL